MLTLLTANVGNGLRFVTVHDRHYAVANVTMIVPGVLPGSAGALYYPPDEIAKNYHAWNGMPLVVYHPQINGQNVSARNSDIFQKQTIGWVYNATVDSDGRLKAEAWFDLDLTKRIDDRVYQALMQKNKIEVSTGLFTDNETAPDNSEYNGIQYTAIARNYRPDHLAILPDQIGACSLQDGCGVFNALVVNVSIPKWVKDKNLYEDALREATRRYIDDSEMMVKEIYERKGGTVGNEESPNYPEECPHCQTALEIDPDSGICNRCGKKVDPINPDKRNCNCIKSSMECGCTMNETMLDRFAANSAGIKDKLKTIKDNDFLKYFIDDTKNKLKNVTDNAKKAALNEDGSFLEWAMNGPDDVKSRFVKMMKDHILRGGKSNVMPPPVKETEEEETDTELEVKENVDPVVPEKDKEEDPMKPQPAANKNKNKNYSNVQDWLKDQPEFVKEMYATWNQATVDQKKTLALKLTEHVTDQSKRNTLCNNLMKKSVDDLKLMVDLLPPKQETRQEQNFFGAQGAITDNANPQCNEDDLLEIPVINWAEEAKNFKR